MLKIHLITGTAFTTSILVKGSLYDDLLELLDNYHEEKGLPAGLLHKPEELTDEDMEEMLPINGGEFYIDGISHVEQITL